MQKKLIALAVAGMAAAPAFAQSHVVLYGVMDVAYERTNVSGGGVKKNNFNSQTSLLGVRGEEALGNGLTAWFQAETTITADGRSAGAGNNLASFGSRNTAVGLKGGFGNLFVGGWDSPYKINGAIFDVFRGQTYGIAGALVGNGTTTGANPANTNAAQAAGGALSFDRRVSNSITYQAPAFFPGFNAALQYGANEEKNAAGNDQSLVALSLGYANGPLAVGYAFEQHKGFAGGAANDKDTGNRIAGSYDFGMFKLAAAYERLKLKSTIAADDQKNAAITGSVKVGGAGAVSLGLSRSDPEGSGNNAKQLSLGYTHNLSKRTQAYAVYSKITNDAGSARTFVINNSLGGQAAGQDPSVIGLGVKHTF